MEELAKHFQDSLFELADFLPEEILVNCDEVELILPRRAVEVQPA